MTTARPWGCFLRWCVRKVIENQKTRAQNFDDETDMIDAFVACGGRMDKTGHVKRCVDQHWFFASEVWQGAKWVRERFSPSLLRGRSKTACPGSHPNDLEWPCLCSKPNQIKERMVREGTCKETSSSVVIVQEEKRASNAIMRNVASHPPASVAVIACVYIVTRYGVED